MTNNAAQVQYIHGDNLEVMRAMPAASVDLVVTSPPYEDARLYGELGFKVSGQAWVDWCVPRFLECLRVCRGVVAWVVAGRTRNYRWSATPALLIADLHRAGVNLRNPAIYERDGIPGSGGPDWLKSRYEWIICASRPGRLPWSDSTAMGHPPKYGPGGQISHRTQNGERVNLRLGGMRRENGERRKHGYTVPDRANPGNIIDCGAGGGGHMGSRLAHENEAPFPELIPEWFIRSFCPPGGTVLDCHAGSGTTGAVAVKHGRNAILIDSRRDQIDLCKRRIAEVKGFAEGGDE